MPRPTPAPARRSAPAAPEVQGTVRFSFWNLVLLLTGLFAIIAGYFGLAEGSTVAAPALLVLGYVVLVPLGIIR